MIGIESFRNYFKDFKDQYVIIGGAACELLLTEQKRSFRITKDIDMVLIIESLSKEFGIAFWKYIKEGGYQYAARNSGDVHFYRFSKPQLANYPKMIELFSKNQNWLIPNIDTTIIPIHIDESISSLSAILLNDEYYSFLKNGIKYINDIAVLDAGHIIPFKARAWIDLSERKNSGQHVDSNDIKKHKNDIYRLATLLDFGEEISLSLEIRKDMEDFINKMADDKTDIKQLGISYFTKDDLINMIIRFYKL